ncbi:GCN5 family acetyltransferase [Frateuria sp. Soil773]|uniref:GNAT family N-acetyltransferase n=1 Tax=Frateuria sp. Soil773 TaxID=1736407 RepID=UPI000700BFF1|nr:GNAT family N-acetyltransferase [Frateuria sp. Soil773]KRE89104.1 GCN5 family acetyltransferase [Frateuria sp. Soil773]
MNRITTVDPGEYEALAALWEASVRATHDFLDEADIAALRPLVLHDGLPAVTLRACRDESGRVRGFVGVAGGKVEMLFVDPASRGRGIGRALLAHAVEVLAADALDVNEQNVQALGFYRQAGFEVVGRSPLDGQGRPFPLLHMARRPRRAGGE